LAPENALQMVTFAGLNMKADRSIVSEERSLNRVHNLDATLSESDLSSIAESAPNSDLVSLNSCNRVWNFLICLLATILLSGGLMILIIQKEKEVGDALLGFLAFGLVENLIVRTYTYHRFGVSATNEFTADGCKVYAMICCTLSTVIATACVYFSIERQFDWSLILTATIIIQLLVRYFFFDLKVGLVQFLGVMIGLTSVLVALLLIKEKIVTGLFELATALQINIIIVLIKISVSAVSYEAQATFIQIGFGLTMTVLWVLNLASF
jgi:hypothetical protein